MIYEQLGLHDLKCHHEEGQSTHDLTPRAVIYVYELSLLGLKIVDSCTGDMIHKYPVEGSTELSKADLVLIHEAEVSGLV